MGSRLIGWAVALGCLGWPGQDHAVEPAALNAGKAQEYRDWKNVRFQRLIGADELPPVEVRSIMLDSRGGLWLAGASGLYRFDHRGYRVQLAGQDGQAAFGRKAVTAMTAGLKGEVWVGTASGELHQVDPLSGVSKVRASIHDLPGDEILALQTDLKGDLWIGTNQGLAKLDLAENRIVTFRPAIGDTRVSALALSAEGDLWIGLYDGALVVQRRGETELYRVWQSTTPISAIAPGTGAAMWIATEGSGLFRYDPATMTILTGTGHPGVVLPSRMLGTVRQDSKGHLWVAIPKGLVRIELASGNVAIYRHDPIDSGSLPGHLVTALCEDRDRGMWVGVSTGLVSRVDVGAFGFSRIRAEDSDANGVKPGEGAIWAFSEEADGSVWVASESGLLRWHAEQGWMPRPVDFPDRVNGLPGEPFVQALLRDTTGRLWVGTRGDGLFRVGADRTLQQYTRGSADAASLPHDSVTALHEDAKGRLWVGTMGGGIARLMDPGSGRSFLAALTDRGVGEDGADDAILDCRHITAMVGDPRGQTWVGSLEGLYVLDGDLGKLSSYRSIEALKSLDLGESPVSSLRIDAGGQLWVGTLGDGVYRIDPVSGETTRYTRSSHGLPDDRVASLAEDAAGILWVATGSGLGRLDPATGRVRRFGHMDGLQHGVFHPGAAARLQHGALVIGGADGFNIIDPSNLPPERTTPTPVLAALELSGETVEPRAGGPIEKPLAETSRLVLAFEQANRLAIKLASGGLADTGPEHFRYRLVGQDLMWNVAGSDRQAIYTALQPGKYQFEAQSSPDGIQWNDVSSHLEVIVRPPWYRTWWAYLLYVVAFGLTVWGIASLIGLSRTRYHRRLIERAEQQRDRAEAELARQLQHALLLDQAGRELGQDRDPRDLFHSALKIVAQQFDATRCSIVACPSDAFTGEGADGTLHLLADYRAVPLADGTPDLVAVDDALDAAIREVVAQSEIAIIPRGSAASRSGALHTIAEHWSPAGGFILRRTAFLDRPNGAIILQRPPGAESLASVDVQTLESLSNQLGIAIAQWRVARQDRIHREALQVAREAAESANRAKSDFLAKMTHELRTPLNAILGFSEVMNEDSELNDRQREVMAIINNSGEHLHEVINGVLDLAKIEAGKIEIHPGRFEIERMLRSLHKMLSLRARSQGLAFPLELLTALPRLVETDKSKLRQILINLLGNALKFTDTGSVTLAAWAEVTGETTQDQGLRRRPIRLYFEVRDTGKGIAPDEIGTLFDQYTQTESGKGAADSTGLGLTIAKAFVELLGGHITVDSTVGAGTTFRFHIACEEISASGALDAEPSADIEIEPEPTAGAGALAGGSPALVRHRPAAAKSPASGSGSGTGNNSNGALRRLAPGQPEVRILIAEDQMPNRLLLRKHLEPAGFVLREAEDGAAAVEMWRKWQPHLILMDEQMPHMTGREATRAIMTEAEETGAEWLPVIVALTAFALDQNRSAAIEAGCSDFLAKPFRREELFGVISRNLPHLHFDGGAETPARDTAPLPAVALAG